MEPRRSIPSDSARIQQIVEYGRSTASPPWRFGIRAPSWRVDGLRCLFSQHSTHTPSEAVAVFRPQWGHSVRSASSHDTRRDFAAAFARERFRRLEPGPADVMEPLRGGSARRGEAGE